MKKLKTIVSFSQAQALSFECMIFHPSDTAHIKKERGKARQLRATSWWKSKLNKQICYFCQKKFPKSQLTMDHLIPLVRGGKSIRNNLVVSCKSCNSQKKYETIVDQRLKGLK